VPLLVHFRERTAVVVSEAADEVLPDNHVGLRPTRAIPNAGVIAKQTTVSPQPPPDRPVAQLVRAEKLAGIRTSLDPDRSIDLRLLRRVRGGWQSQVVEIVDRHLVEIPRRVQSRIANEISVTVARV
jgi:hypothetical protein